MKKFWFIKIGILVIAGFLLLSAVVFGLWNWLVPVLFHGPMISFAQAIGLLVLSKILFHGFGGHRSGGRHAWKHARWNEWKEKMEKMSPEERERMRSLWKQRCNWTGQPLEPQGNKEEKSPGL
ncbi:MAG TPA: hypothetical protein PKK99_07940 [Bacteroidia bacterium]|nr:hypothetical protein [Bacteroidia bacterium]HNP98970.1 hypothetical protein [Bacteroidia bacterium]